MTPVVFEPPPYRSSSLSYGGFSHLATLPTYYLHNKNKCNETKITLKRKNNQGHYYYLFT